MLVCWSIIQASIKFGGTHLYTWVKRSTVNTKRLLQEHNTMSLAKAQTWTIWSGIECINHEATEPPLGVGCRYLYVFKLVFSPGYSQNCLYKIVWYHWSRQNQNKSYWLGRTKTSEIFVGKNGSRCGILAMNGKRLTRWWNEFIFAFC